jgi:Rps23 Pro-64 3,4-dihydroxylase Tpa1-like proline 4-hydroxylase
MRSFAAARRPVNPLINHHVSDTIAEHARRFADARPFRHVVIDDFFDHETARALLREFPSFDPKFARNEAGEIGNKAVVEKIRALGPAYAALDDLIQTQAFLAMIGRITGIEKLCYDPWYYGGGTHDNRNGQELDPHIDFNRHPVDRSHRRLNLIVYLNPEWDDAWGGSLEIHRDPRAPDNQVTLITPLFNRCVIFETNEISWHGFSRIALPPDKQHLSRRSIALYFYTAERPAEELADSHSTIYVDRPLPERFAAGHVLDRGDVEQLELLLNRRDQHNQRLYRELTRLSSDLEHARAAISKGLIGRLEYLARRAIQRLRA